MMSTLDTVHKSSKRETWMLWVGRALGAFVGIGLLASAAAKLTHAAPMIEGFAHFGYAQAMLTHIGLLELICVALFLIPQTTYIGAILITAYLGGAVATHVRIADPFMAPVIIGILMWLSLWLRDARLRKLTPLKSKE